MSDDWSPWLDFDITTIDSVPESPGVCVMHASMKVLYIGAGINLRQELKGRISDPCTGGAKRFKYITTSDFGRIKEQQIREYVSKHGKMPPCMQQDTL